MKSGVHVLDRNHEIQVNTLRLSQYASAQGFRVADAGITWNRSDDQSLVLGAYQEGQLVSTMRMELIDDLTLLEAKIEAPWSFPVEVQMPVALLSRASTQKSARGMGLNALLRYHCILAARQIGAHALVGTFVTESPRVKSMQKMGYQLFSQALGWNRADFQSHRPVSVAYLDLKSAGDRALQTCQTIAASSFQIFPFLGDYPALKPMQVIK